MFHVHGHVLAGARPGLATGMSAGPFRRRPSPPSTGWSPRSRSTGARPAWPATVVRDGEPRLGTASPGTTDADDPTRHADVRHAVPDGLDHQDVHRRPRAPVPGRRPARPRRPARHAPAGHRARRPADPPDAGAPSGLQREPVGEVWERLEGPYRDDLLGRPGRGRGRAAARPAATTTATWPTRCSARSSRGCAVSRGRRCCRLGCSTRWRWRARDLAPTPPYARGYFTDPYADRLHEEPEFPGNAFAPAGRAVVDGRRPRPVGRLRRRAGVRGAVAGHGRGDVPPAGHVRPRRLDARPGVWGGCCTGAATGCSSGTTVPCPASWPALPSGAPSKVGRRRAGQHLGGADPGGLAVDLALRVVDDDPDLPSPWRPGADGARRRSRTCSACGGPRAAPFVFSAKDGHLEAQGRSRRPATSAAVGLRRRRVRTGSGSSPAARPASVLRVVRRPDGTVDASTGRPTRSPATPGPSAPDRPSPPDRRRAGPHRR